MTELERKKFKAFVFGLRYDELELRIATQALPPEVLFRQIEDFSKKIDQEIAAQRNGRLVMFDYHKIKSKLPRLLSALLVQKEL